MASCAKSGVVYEPENEIRLVPKTVPATKAEYKGAVASTDYPTTENFDVIGYWSGDWSGNQFVKYIVAEDGSGAEFTCQGNYWTGKVSYHWPKDGSLKFACYSPASENIIHNYPTDTYSKVGYVQSSNTAETSDLLLAATTGAYTAETAMTTNVPVAFDHALSWITIQVKSDVAKMYEIKKITIKDVCTKANFEVKMGDGIQYEEWEKQSDKADIVIFDGSQVVEQAEKAIETNPQGTIIIPQTTTKAVIEYTQLAIEGGTAELPDQTIELDLTLKAVKYWEPGKHYTYTVSFKPAEIRIQPKVNAWGKVDVEKVL